MHSESNVTAPQAIPDNTPVIVSAAQCVEQPGAAATDTMSSPMDLAARACGSALQAAGVGADEIDSIAVIRLFSDSAPAWASPFGGSNNPPESVAHRLGARPDTRIYSNAGGTEPLTMLMELLQRIGRGESRTALLCGTEAIANQRHAMRNGIELDWQEEFDAPLDARQYLKRFASAEELRSGMALPVHYYALIENAQAQAMGHSPAEHTCHMSRMLASFSEVSAENPHAQFPRAYTAEEIAGEAGGNYAISLPYRKRMVAQDAVNQSAALLLTSAGRARALGIDERLWVAVDAYAQGEEQPLTQRLDVAHSEVMSQVMRAVMAQEAMAARNMDLIDIYSCFPCAVQAACDALDLPADGSIPLTITGGLPFFGGPGNNYTLHALAEAVTRLQGDSRRALITANGGILSKHAAAVLAPVAELEHPVQWGEQDLVAIDPESIQTVPYVNEPQRGTVMSYTVIFRRDKDDIGIVLAEDDEGRRFLASSTVAAVTQALCETSPTGRTVQVIASNDGRHVFEFA